MKQSILETAIIQSDWKNILKFWPQINVKECFFPFDVHYIAEELNEHSRIFFYLFEMNKQNHFDAMDQIIPHLPFCLMIANELDASFEKLLQKYQERYETPLFLVLPDDERLKERIAHISRFEYQLPEFIVLQTEQTFQKTIVELIKNILEKLNDSEVKSEDQEITESPPL